MSRYRRLNDVEIYAFLPDPPDDIFDKALAYVMKVSPPELQDKIRTICVFANQFEHFTLYGIRYEVLMSAGDTLTGKDLGLEDA